MKKQILAIIIGLVLLNSLNIATANSTNESIESNTFIVDDDGIADFRYIQDAINNSNNGDTIFICNGTYYENIEIDKQIRLIGEDKNNTIIDAKSHHFAILVKQDNVCIMNLSFVNSTEIKFPDPWEYGAISVWYSSKVSIKNNRFSKNFIGICLFQSKNCIVKNNFMIGCNIVIWGDKLDNYQHEFDNSNTANNKPIIYHKKLNDICISGNIAQLFLINCTNCEIKNTNISNVTNGLSVCYSNNILIDNNTITDIQSTGIHFDHSNYCIVKNNILLDHKALDFIFLDYSSHNTFQYNIVKGDAVGITLMRQSHYNKFYRNEIGSKLNQGMIFDQSNYNEIKHNNINGSFVDRILNKGPGDVLLSRGAFFNKFDQNYWESWIGNKYKFARPFPKLILGIGSAIVEPHNFPIFFDFDMHPASEPYNI